jgi:hypothetical protein
VAGVHVVGDEKHDICCLCKLLERHRFYTKFMHITFIRSCADNNLLKNHQATESLKATEYNPVLKMFSNATTHTEILHCFIQKSTFFVLFIAALGLEPIATCIMAVFLGCDSIECVAVGCMGIWLAHSLLCRSVKIKAINKITKPQTVSTIGDGSYSSSL